jgi:hypothetical protein
MADCEELRQNIANHLLHNDNSDVKDLNRALDLIDLDNKCDIKDYIFVNQDKYYHSKDKLNHLIVDNKFLDISWEIVLEDQSSKSLDISQVKIVVKISYMSVSKLAKKELNLIFDENTFDVWLCINLGIL